ncbi:MAG: DinB family protein [Gemmatimonadota bacterium]|nr:DinB family protein [Gemmatimonadota bacterium]
MPEAWLSGPIDGVPERLMPVAHSLVDAVREIEAVRDLDPGRLWKRPSGAASVGFHLRHIPGAIDRLLTYARGEPLSPEQRAYLEAESDPGDPPEGSEVLVDLAIQSIHAALDALRSTPEASLFEARSVGRAGLPSTVQGLLFHAAEHTRRHCGQIIVTAKVVRAESI